MNIDLSTSSPALISIIEHPEQIITLDANLIIPPYRIQFSKQVIEFDTFRKIWLDPIFEAFPNLAIHEAVYKELVGISSQTYIDSKMASTPPEITIHKDSSLTGVELVLRETIESKIAPKTKYDPILDNKDDRGEVKSLSYIAVKELLYFAAHDNNAIQLIEKSEQWSTGLDNVRAIKIYELIFYLYKNSFGNKDALRMLYKYQYYLTAFEKKTNPEWGVFIATMEELYAGYF
jgi:hypothetical protein